MCRIYTMFLRVKNRSHNFFAKFNLLKPKSVRADYHGVMPLPCEHAQKIRKIDDPPPWRHFWKCNFKLRFLTKMHFFEIWLLWSTSHIMVIMEWIPHNLSMLMPKIRKIEWPFPLCLLRKPNHYFEIFCKIGGVRFSKVPSGGGVIDFSDFLHEHAHMVGASCHDNQPAQILVLRG